MPPIPFIVEFRNGTPIFEQVVYAAKKAIIAGIMRTGDPFPSVRALSRELQINPNTSHKVVTCLLNEGFLETKPGVGTVVAQPITTASEVQTKLLNLELEALVVEAIRLSIPLEQVLEFLKLHWNLLEDTNSLKRGPHGAHTDQRH